MGKGVKTTDRNNSTQYRSINMYNTINVSIYMYMATHKSIYIYTYIVPLNRCREDKNLAVLIYCDVVVNKSGVLGMLIEESDSVGQE